MLLRILVRDVGQAVAVPLPGEYFAGSRFEFALWPFEHGHVVGLASRPVDARHHADGKHAADAARVVVIISVEIAGQPRFEPWLLVPNEPVEIIAHGMKGALVARVLVRGVPNVRDADALEPRALQIAL